MQSDVKTIGDVVDIVKRRKWSIVIPALVIFLTAAIVALALPKIYRSTSTILIEAQEIPREYVTSNVTSYADQRLQSINQTLLGTTKILEIINRFDLYKDLRKSETVEEIVGKMRKDINFSTISAEVVDPRTGRPAQATIAFSVSYQGRNPTVVHKVANELASLYLEENLRTREKQSLETSKFLEDEMRSVQAALTEVDTRIAAYKEAHLTSLPELTQVNMQALDLAERDLTQMKDQLRNLNEREGYLRSQLASIPTDTVSQEKENLRELRTLLVDLKSRFSEEYPDVVKTRAAIAALEQQLGSKRDVPGPGPDNPVYVTLASQLAGNRAEMATLKRSLAELNQKRDDFRRRIEETPRVEGEYRNLVAERNNLQGKYDELTKKSMDAKVAHGLEKEQLGERFSIVDPARLPEKPVSPNVPAIMLIGLILGLGGGVGLAALRESSDRSVRSPEALARATSFPVLAAIPVIVTRQEIGQRQGRRKLTTAGVVLGLVAVVVVFNFWVMDLDVFWAKLLRKVAP